MLEAGEDVWSVHVWADWGMAWATWRDTGTVCTRWDEVAAAWAVWGKVWVMWGEEEAAWAGLGQVGTGRAGGLVLRHSQELGATPPLRYRLIMTNRKCDLPA